MPITCSWFLQTFSKEYLLKEIWKSEIYVHEEHSKTKFLTEKDWRINDVGIVVNEIELTKNVRQ